MHGYQLSRELGESLGGFWRVSYGSLYPSLRRLEKEGAVESVASDEERGRPAQERLPHHREGREALLRAAAGDAARQLHARTRGSACASRSSSTCRRRRGSACSNGVARSSRTGSSTIKDSLRATRERVDDYTLSLMEHGRNATESDIAWLDGLIAGRAPPQRWHRHRRGNEASYLVASQKGAHLMSKVRLAIVGVGNCASSLVQGLEYYKDAEPGRSRARADARGPGRLPRRRHRGRRRVRRGREEGRHRRRRGDLLRAEQHDPVRGRRAAHGRHGAARPHVRRPRHLLPRDDRRVRAAAGRRGAGRSATRRPTCSCATCRSAPSRPREHYAQAAIDAGVGVRELPSGVHRLGRSSGRRSSSTPACRSSATTSRARSARRSCTAS